MDLLLDGFATALTPENLLFADPVSRMLSEVASIGPLTHLSTRALQPRPTWGDFTRRHWGGGVFFDLGVHPLALVLRAAGAAPVGVRAFYDASPDVDTPDSDTPDDSECRWTTAVFQVDPGGK